VRLTLSEQLERWLTSEAEKTLGSLVHTFGDKSFAILLVVLLGLDTLPVLGVVALSLGVLLEDVLIALGRTVLVATGIALELALGAAAVHGISAIV
jgi:hypothetical protein